MTTEVNGGSAIIYAFPARGRFAVGHDVTKPAATLSSERAAKSVCSSGWYHEEAIQDAERARKN